ncbi:hypothetical protein HDV02_005509 [Globomyces sp. JEL0801]|nr:hypothetical protein HDV02_005509 [Globomyces sp. JEL0801]
MPPQGQGLTDRNALQQALQNERIFGVSTHRSHPSNLKSFKGKILGNLIAGPYLLVEEPSGTYKPIAIKEYTTPEDLDNPPWPMIHFGTHSPYTAFAIGSGNDDTEHSSDPVENQENVNPLGENSNASGLISGSIVSIFSRTASENPSLRGLTNREINPNILQRVVDTTSMNKRLRGNEVEERPAKRQKSGKPQHVSGKRHRKFAMNQTNFLQLDRFLSKVERQPIKEQISHQVLQRVDSNIMDNDLTLINLVQSETTPTKSNNVKQDLTPNDILPRHESFFPADQEENQKPLLSPSIEPRVSEKVEVCEMIDDSVEYLGSKLHSLADVCVKVNPTIEIQSALTSFAKNHELEENTLNSKQSLLEAVKRDLKSTINTELNLETVAKDETILELYQQVIDVVVADEINRVLETKTVELSADIIEQARKHILDELMMKEWNEKLKQIIMEQLNDFVLATSRDIANRQEANVKDEVELISLTTPRQSRKMSIESPTKTRNNYRDISRPKKPFSPKPFVKSMGNNRHRPRHKSTYNGSTIEEERKGDIRDQQVIKGLRDNRGIPVVQSVSRKIVP